MSTLLNKYYRVDKTATELLNKPCFDETLSIEKRKDSKNRIYCLLIEEYQTSNYIYKKRVSNEFLEIRIKQGLFKEKELENES